MPSLPWSRWESELLSARNSEPETSRSRRREDVGGRSGQITTTGKNKMPAYKGKLTDDQINALAKYIKEIEVDGRSRAFSYTFLCC